MFNFTKYQKFLHKITETEDQINSIKRSIKLLQTEQNMKVNLVVSKWNEETQTIHTQNEDVIGMLNRLLQYNQEELHKSQEIIHVLDLLLKGDEK